MRNFRKRELHWELWIWTCSKITLHLTIQKQGFVKDLLTWVKLWMSNLCVLLLRHQTIWQPNNSFWTKPLHNFPISLNIYSSPIGSSFLQKTIDKRKKNLKKEKFVPLLCVLGEVYSVVEAMENILFVHLGSKYKRRENKSSRAEEGVDLI